MRRSFSPQATSSHILSHYWLIYILLLISIFIINCILSCYSLVGVTLAIKIFTISAFIPLPIYLLESIFTRDKYVEIFSELRGINATLKPAMQKHVMQLSSENAIKIIFVLLMFTVQLAIISVKCFIYGNIRANV